MGKKNRNKETGMKRKNLRKEDRKMKKGRKKKEGKTSNMKINKESVVHTFHRSQIMSFKPLIIIISMPIV